MRRPSEGRVVRPQKDQSEVPEHKRQSLDQAGEGLRSDALLGFPRMDRSQTEELEERSKFKAQRPEMFRKSNGGIISSHQRLAGRSQGP